MISQPADGERRFKQQLKSQLLLVNFYFVLAQFQIKMDRFSLVFPTYVPFITKIAVLFLSLFSRQIFKLTSKIWPTCSAAVCPPFSVSTSIDRT